MPEEASSIRQNTEDAGRAPWRNPERWLPVLLVANAVAAGLTFILGTAAVGAFAVLVALLTLVAGLLLLRNRRSPALAEARVMALTARIRPHFLFNSLNGILGIIRSDPRRAEKALEELAELFRALMHDQRELAPLSEEIALCRHYIELEKLRLGDRIRVNWDIEQCPPDALVPPLMLQPLLENAVYHGIEPAAEPGTIEIKLLHSGTSVVIALSNPYENTVQRQGGNQMALENIRERLMLFYDRAANLETEVSSGRYIVRIVIPYRNRLA